MNIGTWNVVDHFMGSIGFCRGKKDPNKVAGSHANESKSSERDED